MPDHSPPETVELQSSLRKWKLAAVGLLFLLSVVITIWAVARGRNDPNRHAIQGRDKETIRIQGEDGTTTEIRNIRSESTGAVLQETLIRDKEGRIVDGGLRPGLLPADTPGTPIKSGPSGVKGPPPGEVKPKNPR
jgi:hypothetical protein